ncbi:nSTAND1 domain-containing NTPase [Streptomyces sp. JNUCC 64]
MGRREKPLDPSAGPVGAFAEALRELRRTAGAPTYRAMAAGSPYSASTLSAAASGERLPSLPVVLAYVRACGGDPEGWERRWRGLRAGEAALADGAGDGDDGPYPGLARFGTGDGARFFGRDELVAELRKLVRDRPFTALVGASGSGKSSLLRAGLVPALREGGGDAFTVIRLLTPGPTPARTHRGLFTEGALLLVDQFEEVFTLCRDPAERDAFIALLTRPGVRTVVAVRADFIGRCAERPALAAALRDTVLVVGPMTPPQLREAVVGPATAERLIVERSLTSRIVADTVDAPGGLPLMAHALREVWRRRRGRTLTEEAYEAIGGVRGALAHTAERVLDDFDTDEVHTARRLLLRLISPGDATADTRRPAPRAELAVSPGSARVLERLVRARLLTVDDQTVDLAHEALISGWPRLRQWVEEDREALRLHRGLTEAAQRWEAWGRDEGALYRGAQLESVREVFHVKHGARDLGLTPDERAFLLASLRAQDSALRTATRTARRLRLLTVALSLLLCVAVVAGLAAWHQGGVSGRRAVEADARRLAAAAEELRTGDPELAMRLSLAAWHAAELPETEQALFASAAQPHTSAFTPVSDESPSRHAWEVFTRDGATLLRVGPEATERWDVELAHPLRSAPGTGSRTRWIRDVSPDGRTAAIATPDGTRLWDLGSARFTTPGLGPGRRTADAWFGPGGRTVATHARDRPFQLWSTSTGRNLLRTPAVRSGELNKVALSPDDRLAAFCPDDDPLQLWDVRERRRLPARWATGADCRRGDELVFTPDGRALAFPGPDGLRVREARTGRERWRIRTEGEPSVAFGADGSHVATLTAGVLRLWRTDEPTVPVLQVPTGTTAHAPRLDLTSGTLRYREGAPPRTTVRTVRFDPARLRTRERPLIVAAGFSPDGGSLLTARPGTHQLRDARGKLRRSLDAPDDCGPGCAARFGFQGDGRRFAQVDGRGRVVVRDARDGRAVVTLPARSGITGLVLGWHGSRVSVSRASPDLVTTTSSALLPHGPADASAPGRPRWSPPRPMDGALLASGPGLPLFTDRRQRLDPDGGVPEELMDGEGTPVAVAFAPDRAHMAMIDQTGRITLWDGLGALRLAVLSPGGERPSGGGSALAFSPDGRTLAAGDEDGELRLWDLAAPDRAGRPLPRADGPVLALAFAPDGRGLTVTTPHTAARRYPLSADAAARTVCARVRGGLDRAEWGRRLPGVPYRTLCPSWPELRPQDGFEVVWRDGGWIDLEDGVAHPARTPDRRRDRSRHGSGRRDRSGSRDGVRRTPR